MIKMLNGKIAVNKISKSANKTLFAAPESVDNIGIVAFVDHNLVNAEKIKIGDRICFGSKRERMAINGKDLEIMDFDNIIAILGSNENEEKSPAPQA